MKRPAYSYQFVANERSSSSSDMYTVKLRLDNRLTDPLDRARAAVLTCNCPGWTNRRTCRHVDDHASALTRFQSTAEREARAESEPWLPELRDSYGIPEHAPVTVQDLKSKLVLYWRSSPRDTQQIVAVTDSAQRRFLTGALKRSESRFFPLVLREWSDAHPITARALPWGLNLRGALEAASSEASETQWVDSVMDFEWLGAPVLEPEVPAVNFGSVPKTARIRRARYDDLFAKGLSTEPRWISWTDEAGEHTDWLTPSAFAERIGVAAGRDHASAERLAELCGVALVSPVGPLCRPPGANPYNLFDYQLLAQPIRGFTIDTAQHKVVVWPDHATPDTKTNRAYWAWEHADSLENFVHVRLLQESESSDLAMYLDLENMIDAAGEDHEWYLALCSIAAEFLLRCGWPAEAQVTGYDRPAPAGEEELFNLPLSKLAASRGVERAPEHWQLTALGKCFLQSVLFVEAFAAAPGQPTPQMRAWLNACLDGLKAAMPQLPMAPAPQTSLYALQRDLRQWLKTARAMASSPEGCARLGSGATADCFWSN